MFLKRLCFWLVQGGVAFGQYRYMAQWFVSDSNAMMGEIVLRLATLYIIPSFSMLILLLIFLNQKEELVGHAFAATILLPAAATLTAFILYVKETGHFFMALVVLVIFAIGYAVAGLLVPFIIASCFGFARYTYSGGPARSDSSPPPPPEGSSSFGGMDGTSVTRTDMWGNEYIEHRDERGNIIGRSVPRKNFWGDDYMENQNRDGTVVGRSEMRTDFWGDPYVEHRSKDGTATGKSEARTDFWGDPYIEHRCKDGTVTGRSETRTDFWGDEYTKHTKK